jgi:hypothetical protein
MRLGSLHKLKVICTFCNDWEFLKRENEYGIFIDIRCPRQCQGKRKIVCIHRGDKLTCRKCNKGGDSMI